MKEIAPLKRAGAYKNKEIIALVAMSGYAANMFDPLGKQLVFPQEISDAELGDAVISVLQTSRFLTLEEDGELYNSRSETYSAWVNSLMKQFHYKTKSALFGNMLQCGIERVGESITISPSNHNRLQGWGRERGDGIEDVIIPADSPLAEVGAALRLGFSRCIGKGAYFSARRERKT